MFAIVSSTSSSRGSTSGSRSRIAMKGSVTNIGGRAAVVAAASAAAAAAASNVQDKNNRAQWQQSVLGSGGCNKNNRPGANIMMSLLPRLDVINEKYMCMYIYSTGMYRIGVCKQPHTVHLKVNMTEDVHWRPRTLALHSCRTMIAENLD